MLVKIREMKRAGQVVLVLVSIAFTTYQKLVNLEPFFTLDFFIFTLLAWFVGWQYDLLRSYERKAQASNESYRLLIDSLPESVFIHQNNKLIYVNHAAIKMMEAKSLEDLIGYSFGDFLDAAYKDRWEERMKITSQETRPLTPIEYKMKRLDGTSFFFESSCLAVDFNRTKTILSMGRDVTQLKEKTQHLIQKSEKMSLIGQMSAGIAHEIRNPLTSIKGFIQLAKIDREKIDYFDIVLAEIERINSIVSELLFIAKPAADVFLKKDITTIIKDVITLVNAQFLLNNILIYVSYDQKQSMILCDENRLKQVFINLLQNAMEAMPTGGTIYIKVRDLDDGNIAIEIIDQGVGIEAERIDTLGEPFFTTKEKGTGLGLMTCYKIIESHNGRMSFCSELNKGTTVTIQLPLALQKQLLEV
ncbi:ATP-binding protein [Bacillus sp. B1-b2]|uniref:ATP-binding protein n=1 Tax=Bacillus sp. B1-b2 TaxID=2653201 RepID=UPI001261CA2D|nr:ATP-binding protein [Bacillus sp. B1-b2]KAB7671666.1 PAS domain S-box protein [Bacillus sp. B1-b2]